ncbi:MULTISPECIES: hypothetical protein [Pseudomonas]|uniref:Transmembrane protein n=1 Tax=Pseudomonas fulva TaxID=47880 RepID=A0A0D0L3T6_9PSED|nr:MULTISPECIES: hypothetical protein [Pseudomonas]KIQ04343.1 hypothetical protein RU08_05200 [Pseudomonas fulva]
MTRWLDKPSMDSDELIDHVIERSQRFFARYSSPVAKFCPPLFGFAIFLFYFNRHGFYPTFDLFQFSSLLLAAAILGFVLIGTYVLLLMVPGAWLHYGFTNSPAIKDDLRYIRPSSDRQTYRFVGILIGLVYIAPFAGSALSVMYVTINYTSLFQPAIFLIPALVTLVSGLAVQKLLELRSYSFLRYMWSAYIPAVIVALFSFLIIRDAATGIDRIESGLLRACVVYGTPLLISALAGLCAISFVAGWSFTLHFATFFALLIAFYSGLLTALPDKTIGSIGLGNYQAERIIFDDAYCDAETRQALALDERCSLENVHVVWLMGDTLSFKATAESDRLIQVPSRFIKLVIKAPK